MQQLHSTRAVLFDIDGLLINTEDVYANCIQSLLRERSCPSMPEKLLACTMGSPEKFNIDAMRNWIRISVLGKDKWTTEEDFVKDVNQRCALERKNVEMLPGAENLIRIFAAQARTADKRSGSEGSENCTGLKSQFLSSKRLKVALVSNTTRAKFEAKTFRHREIFSLFPSTRVFCSDDVRLATYSRKPKPKPAPDLYLAALRVLNEEQIRLEEETAIRADECLVFEDSVVGVEAAVKAGMNVVWVPHPLVREAYKGLEQDVLSGTLSAEDTHNPVLADEQKRSDSHWYDGGTRANAILIESLENFGFDEDVLVTDRISV